MRNKDTNNLSSLYESKVNKILKEMHDTEAYADSPSEYNPAPGTHTHIPDYVSKWSNLSDDELANELIKLKRIRGDSKMMSTGALDGAKMFAKLINGIATQAKNENPELYDQMKRVINQLRTRNN